MEVREARPMENNLITIMEIAFLLLGIFNLFTDTMFGLILIGIVILLWLIGFIWDKKQSGDWFYSWMQLSKLWKDDVSGEVE